MHAIIPASRPRIPIEYFRACTWNPTRVFRQVPTPSCTPTLPFRICHVRARREAASPSLPSPTLSGEKRRRTMLPIMENLRLAALTVNWNVKASSLLKNTHAHPAPLCTDQRSIRSLERNPIVCLSNEPRDSPPPPLVPSMSRATISSYVPPQFSICTFTYSYSFANVFVSPITSHPRTKQSPGGLSAGIGKSYRERRKRENLTAPNDNSDRSRY